MSNDALLHPASPRRDDWCTPAPLLDAVRATFGGQIGLDPCSNAESLVNAVLEYQLPDNDGLALPWDSSTVFVNPPFGRGIKFWLAHCHAAHVAHGAEVIALIPAAVEQKHWTAWVDTATLVCFLRRRVTFVGATSGAPMPIAIVYWGSRPTAFRLAFRPLGSIWRCEP